MGTDDADMDDGLRVGARRIGGRIAGTGRARLAWPRQAFPPRTAASGNHPVRTALPAMHRLACHRTPRHRRHRGTPDTVPVGA